MRKNKGFTLIEIIIVLAITGILLALSVIGGLRYKNALEYSYSVNQVLSDIKMTQQLAGTSHEMCKIEFKSGKNEYHIVKAGTVVEASCVSPKVQFYGKSYFSFIPSGYTEVGGSGTLFLGGGPRVKKIIVSSRGRIRVE